MLPSIAVTAAGPLLGPALRRIRATPLPRLVIGYRIPPLRRLENFSPHRQQALVWDRELERCATHARALGHGLLLDRILTGGNQNELLPLANQRILAEQRAGVLPLDAHLGRNFDAWA